MKKKRNSKIKLFRFGFTFSGFVLLITHLGFGLHALVDEDGIRAIGSLCPHLKSISLNASGYSLLDESDFVTPHKLDEILNDWPKVNF